MLCATSLSCWRHPHRACKHCAAAFTPKQAVSLGAFILPIASVRIRMEKAGHLPSAQQCLVPCVSLPAGFRQVSRTLTKHLDSTRNFELHLPHTRVLLKERAVQPVALARGWSPRTRLCLWAGAASRGTLHRLCSSACCKNTAQCREEPSRGNTSGAAGVGRTSCSFIGTERTTQP